MGIDESKKVHPAVFTTIADVLDNIARSEQKYLKLEEEGDREYGMGYPADVQKRDEYQKAYKARVIHSPTGKSWRSILMSEVLELFAEKNPDRIREEAMDVAAVAIRLAASVSLRDEEECSCVGVGSVFRHCEKCNDKYLVPRERRMGTQSDE